jgi:hypothetical protein
MCREESGAQSTSRSGFNFLFFFLFRDGRNYPIMEGFINYVLPKSEFWNCERALDDSGADVSCNYNSTCK